MKKLMEYLLIVIAVLYAVSGSAEVYKWVDERGVVHYGDKEKSGSELMELQDYKTTDAPAATSEDSLSREEKRQRISDMMEEDRLEKNKERERKKIERERKRRECNRLKDYQRQAKHATGLYKLDKDGNRVFMSNDQRKKSEQDLSKRIQKACN